MELNAQASSFAVLLLGFLIGLRHALDADHLAAVSAIVSDRKSLLSSSVVGGLWGIGHTISLFVVGAFVVFLKISISESLEGYFEAAVGVMLFFLGVNVLRKVVLSHRLHLHTHEHNGHVHNHPHVHEAEESEESHHRLGPRSLVVGMVHGLAGSAGLMLLILPTIASPYTAMIFIVIFGVGSILGMVVMSFLMGLPLYLTEGRYSMVNNALKVAAGLFSLVWGAMLVHEKLIQG